jgi:DGQHR domain-containing protein
MKQDRESIELFGPLLLEPSKIKREAVRRRKLFDEQPVSASEIAAYEAEGWQVDRKLKRSIRMKRPKAIDERLENRFWLFLARLGYPEINAGRKFTIVIDRKGAEQLRKQVDVFAKDDETVVVAECKAAGSFVKRSLQKDIEEFANLKKPIAQAIHKHYGEDKKFKIIWLFVTENIIWSLPDKERAKGANIRIITEKELRYYSQIADHIGKAARYQFLAEFLKDQSIPELSGKTVPAVKGKLGGRRFYCFVTTPRHLLKISFVNHRSLNDPEGAPTYQRLVNRTRIREIGEFIKAGGFFPNNLLINFIRPIRFDKSTSDDSAEIQFGQLFLPDKYRSAWIIDGQHRLYGFAPIDDKYLDQNVIVVAFEQLSKAEEAKLFVTINHEQKSVPKNLLDDLAGDLEWGSDIPSRRIGAISARLINLLNAEVGEPFFNRIAQQGMSATGKTNLTLPALKDALRRSGLLGRAMLNNKVYDHGPFCGTNDSETLDRARTALNEFFSLVRNANMAEWDSGRDGFVCTNVAVQAYIMLFGAIIKYWESDTASNAREMDAEEIMMGIEEYFGPVREFLESSSPAKIKEEFQVQFGAGGPPEYFFRLCKLVKAKYADFQPEGLADWEAEQSEDRVNEADAQLKSLVSEMRNYIFSVFRSMYGEKNNAYWENGVADPAVKTAAYTRSQDYPLEDRLPLETYLEVVEMKKILENKKVWTLFKPVFDIPEFGEKGQAKNLKWMLRVNELRRIPGHPAKERKYKLEDFEYIDYIHGEFMARLASVQNEPAPEFVFAVGEDDD